MKRIKKFFTEKDTLNSVESEILNLEKERSSNISYYSSMLSIASKETFDMYQRENKACTEDLDSKIRERKLKRDYLLEKKKNSILGKIVWNIITPIVVSTITAVIIIKFGLK